MLQYNFRPGNPTVAIGAPITADNGVDPDQPQTQLQVPAARRAGRHARPVEPTAQERPGAARHRRLRVDEGPRRARQPRDQARPGQAGRHRVARPVQARRPGRPARLLHRHRPENDDIFLDLVPIAPISSNRQPLETQIDGLIPTRGTPLYDVTGQSFDRWSPSYDPTRINAVVLLTDGRNDDGDAGRRRAAAAGRCSDLHRQSQGENGLPVRLFTIGYGGDADLGVLQRDGRGHQRRQLRRQRPEEHHQGLHRRGEQLLTTVLAADPSPMTGSPAEGGSVTFRLARLASATGS